MYISKSIFGPAAKRPLMMKRQGSAALTAASKILRRTKKAPTVIRKRATVRKLPAARPVGSPKLLSKELPTSSLYAGVSDKWKAVISDAIMDAVATDPNIKRRSRHNSASSAGSESSSIIRKKPVRKPAAVPEEPATCSSLYAGVSDQWKALISDAIMDAVTVGPKAVQGRRSRHGSGSSTKSGSSGSRAVFKRKTTKKPASKPNALHSLPQEPATCSLFAGVSDKWKTLISDAIMDAVSMDPNVIQGRQNRRGSVSSIESGSSESSVASSVVSSASSTGSRKSTGTVAKVTRTANGRVSKLRHRRVQKAVKRLSVKPRAAQLEKIKREKIDDEDFCLNQLNWSSWKPAMAPVAMDTKQEWIERRGERPGVRNVDLFTSSCHKPAVYEFAVQPPSSDNLHPVLSRATAGFTGNHWDTKLLNGLSVEAQVDRVLKRGCKVFVRRAPFSRPIKNKNLEVSTINELRSLIQKTYDYAWQEHYDVPSRKYFHRNVRRDGVTISDNPPEWM